MTAYTAPIEDIKFVIKTFDIDDAKNKAELHKLWLETYKTPNEIRREEGMEPLEDESADKLKQATSFGQNPDENDYQDTQDEAQKPDEGRKLPKPKNNEKKKKSLVNDKLLTKTIKQNLDANRKKIIALIESEMKPNILSQVKGIRELAERVKALMNFEGMAEIVNRVINKYFMDGWEEGEKAINQNFMPDTDAIKYIADYTFDNIKGMNEEIAEDLRQELKRAYMAGEGIAEIKKRVEKVFDVGKNRAEMISRTETTRASSNGMLGALKAGDAKGKKEWVATLDNRTSALCRRLDGQKVDLYDDFKDPKGTWSGKCSPSHVMCRCSLSFHPED